MLRRPPRVCHLALLLAGLGSATVGVAPAAAASTVSASVSVGGSGEPPTSRPLPDLSVSTVGVSTSAAGVSVGADVVNLGAGRARRSELSFVFSADARPDGADVVAGSFPLRRFPVGGTASVEAQLPAPGTAAYLLVCVDRGGAVREANETNNCFTALRLNASTPTA